MNKTGTTSNNIALFLGNIDYLSVNIPRAQLSAQSEQASSLRKTLLKGSKSESKSNRVGVLKRPVRTRD